MSGGVQWQQESEHEHGNAPSKATRRSLAAEFCGDDVTAMPPVSFGYADVNGIRLYHEIYGAGEPLVLLHGA